MANPKINSGDVLKGAAAVTVAAGVVAAGVMLSDKKNRKKAGKIAAKGIKMAKEVVQEIGDEAQDRYQAVQMAVPAGKRSTTSTSSKKPAKSRTKKS